MTLMEMRLRFQEFAFEMIGGNISPEFYIDSTSIKKYLNEAVVKYINDKFLSLPSFHDKTILIGRNLNDLKNLIKIIDLDQNTVSAHYPNSLTFKSSSVNIWHYLSLTGKLTRSYPHSANDILVDLLPIEPKDINQYLTTYINKPLILVPVFTQVHSQANDSIDNQLSLLVIYDSYTTFTTDTIKAICLVEPSKMELDSDVCELADYLHEDIVRLAVNLYNQEKYKLSQKSKEENK